MRQVLRCRSSTVVAIAFVTLLVYSLSLSAEQASVSFIFYGGEVWDAAYRALIDAFEEANPDTMIERTQVHDVYDEKLAALFAAGTAPDVIALDMHSIMTYGDEHFLHDLNPLIEKTPTYQIQRVATPLLDMYTVNGKLFAAPNVANPSVYVYNVEVLDQAGLARPADLYRTGEWTWSAFRNVARKVTRKDSDGRFSVVGASLHLPRTWLFSNGGSEFDDPKKPTKTFYDTEVALETIQFLHSMIWEDEAMLPLWKIAAHVGADDVVGFSRGHVGMATRWHGSVPAFAQGGFDLGLVPHPKGPAPGGRCATDLGSWGIAITRHAKDLSAAWRFVSFITGPEGAAIEAKMPGRTPARPVRLSWLPASVQNPEIYPDMLTLGTLRVISRDRANLQRIIDNQLLGVWDNTIEPRVALAEIGRQTGAFLKQNPQ